MAEAANPWRHLGSLAFLCLVACAASGVYLYAVFDTSLAGAYQSGLALDRGFLGRLVRGLHRYSADAFAIFTALHLVREALRGHFRFHRAWSWLSGLVLVPLAWIAGITGFWLAWDERALVSAMDAAEWAAAGGPATFAPGALWGGVAAVALALAALPWIGGRPRPAAARVDLANCNGCARCAADCPFGAVVMVARSDGRNHPREALVIDDLCAACGICAGACPSASPFRQRATLASGIDLPQHTVAAMRDELDRRLDAAPDAPVVFACKPARLRTDALAVECAAMVPPAFVQYALRRGAPGVVIAACREDDCEHRVGDRWLRERIAGLRAPSLRASVPRDRVRVVFCGSDDAMLARAIEQASASSQNP